MDRQQFSGLPANAPAEPKTEFVNATRDVRWLMGRSGWIRLPPVGRGAGEDGLAAAALRVLQRGEPPNHRLLHKQDLSVPFLSSGEYFQPNYVDTFQDLELGNDSQGVDLEEACPNSHRDGQAGTGRTWKELTPGSRCGVTLMENFKQRLF